MDALPSLKSYFDRIAVISLPQRSDRRARLRANLLQHGLATDSDLTWVEAVDGNLTPPPAWWQTGPGAWGCRASQLAVLESAQRDGLETVLILEDDAHFHHRSREWLEMVMPLVPDDWDFLFLGGQHIFEPKPTADPRLLKGTGITRTHAYAVHRRAFASVIEQVSDLDLYQSNPSWHIDHQYGQGIHDGLWQAYSPAWWLAAQEEGQSDINIRSLFRRWWVTGNHYWRLPFVTLSKPDRDSDLIYQPDYPEDSVPEDALDRAFWLRSIAREALMQGRLPSCPLAPQEISRLWPGGHRTANNLAELAELADYPANGLFTHAFSINKNS